MDIAEKALRAKADYDAVYEAGKVSSSAYVKGDKDCLYSVADAFADVSAIWTKGDEYVPQSDYFQTDWYLLGYTEYYGPCFTTTGEQVCVGIEYEDESLTFYTNKVFVCVIDGKYYTCTPTDNTDTYTIAFNKALQNTEGGLYLGEKAVQKGWTVVWM